MNETMLHRAHATPFAELGGASGNGIRVRYDGMSGPDGPRIFAVIPLEDLRALPGDIVLSRLSGVGLPGSDLFFMRTMDGPSVYIDTDANQELFDEILDEALGRGIPVDVAEGDLRNLCGLPDPFGLSDGDVRPPRRAAWEANGFAHIPDDIAAGMIARAISPAPSHDSALPEP